MLIGLGDSRGIRRRESIGIFAVDSLLYLNPKRQGYFLFTCWHAWTTFHSFRAPFGERVEDIQVLVFLGDGYGFCNVEAEVIECLVEAC